jgi:hypothetical protein
MSLEEYQLIIPACILLTVCVSVWALLTTKRVRTLVILIPILVTAGYGSFSSVNSILGYPTEAHFTEEHVYLHHRVDKEADKIYVWALTKRRTPRAFAIPYSKDSEKKLNEAQGKSQKGIPQIIEGKDNKNRKVKESDSRDESLRIYDFNMSADIRKNED